MIAVVWYITSIMMYAQLLLEYFVHDNYDTSTVCAAILAYIAAVLSKK